MQEGQIKVFPNVSELTQILNNIECPEPGCTEVFRNTPNLTLHLLKTHGKDGSLKSRYSGKGVEYYCPEISCKYNFNHCENKLAKDKKRCFTLLKYLKQHYMKVHMSKDYICNKCNKGFSTELYKNRHLEDCGKQFICSCGSVYNSLPALQTHSLRKGHTVNKDYLKSSINRTKNKLDVAESSKPELLGKNTYNRPIIPKGTSILYLHGMVGLNFLMPDKTTASVGTNTDFPVYKRRKSSSPLKHLENQHKKGTSRHTQTAERCIKSERKTTETQTVVQYNIDADSRKKNARNCGRKRKKSMETQTCSKADFEAIKSTVTSMDDDDLVNTQKDICLPQLWLNTESKETDFKRSESSLDDDSNLDSKKLQNFFTKQELKEQDYFTKQEFGKGPSKTCHTETQTDKLSSLFDEYFTNCETQTQFLLDQYTRWTQTCDDIVLPDLDFTNNETQTAWSFCNDEDESSLISNVVNSETQTLM